MVGAEGVHDYDRDDGPQARVWKHVMHSPDGTDYPNLIVFKEVTRPERIVYSHRGGPGDGPSAQFESTWTFEAVAERKTRLTIRSVFATAAERERVVREFGALEGAHQTLGRLEGHLQGRARTKD
jgi:uncharacterized protein YndB with AHSA1/START domain